MSLPIKATVKSALPAIPDQPDSDFVWDGPLIKLYSPVPTLNIFKEVKVPLVLLQNQNLVLRVWPPPPS